MALEGRTLAPVPTIANRPFFLAEIGTNVEMNVLETCRVPYWILGKKEMNEGRFRGVVHDSMQINVLIM